METDKSEGIAFIPVVSPPAARQAVESEQRFRNILLQSPDCFAIFEGPDMVVEFANEPMLRSWKSDFAAVGRPLLEVLPQTAARPFLDLLLEVYTTGRSYHGYEEKALLQDNEDPAATTYYDYVCHPVKAANGEVTGVSVMAMDVTEHVKRKKLIEKREACFRALSIATSDVQYHISPDWKEIRELRGGRFLSDDAAGPVADWLSRYVHPGDQPKVWAAIQKAITGKTIFETEHRVLRADGTLGWTFSRAVPVLDESGAITEWFGVASDITARKRMEEALRAAREESEARKRVYEAVTSNTPDLIYVFDLKYRFTYANRALLAMWGKTWEQAAGRSLLEVGYEPWHAAMHEREIDRVVATREPIRGEVSFPHAVLGTRIYDYIFVPVVNAQGTVEAVAGTTRDITEIRRAEEALQRSREQLEALVKERTRALHRSNEDLQQFAHVASHDMKEPVRKVLVFASLLKEEYQQQLGGKGEQYLQKILDSARRIFALVDGILAFSSFQAMEPRTGQVDLNGVIRDIENDLEMVIRQKQASIRHEGLPTIGGFPLLISQLFSNLVSNALKFARNSHPPVIRITAQPVPAHEVQAAGLEEGRDYTKIVLQDNGIGFNQQYAERIFQAFSRLHTKDRFEGTGLGLALCRKIVERHGGIIRASGKENEGATFTIILPLQQRPGADQPVSSPDRTEE